MGWVVNATPPGERETRYPLCSWLGVPQCWSGRVWKISRSPGFDSRTLQPLVSLCTDYVVSSHLNLNFCKSMPKFGLALGLLLTVARTSV
jgi:hypothetical protein